MDCTTNVFLKIFNNLENRFSTIQLQIATSSFPQKKLVIPYEAYLCLTKYTRNISTLFVIFVQWKRYEFAPPEGVEGQDKSVHVFL